MRRCGVRSCQAKEGKGGERDEVYHDELMTPLMFRSVSSISGRKEGRKGKDAYHDELDAFDDRVA